jgi:hypothetical protein
LFRLVRHPPIIAPIGAQRQALLTERLLWAEAKHGQILITHFFPAVEDTVELCPLGDPALKALSRPVAAMNTPGLVSHQWRVVEPIR